MRMGADHAFRRCKTRGFICKAKISVTAVHNIIPYYYSQNWPFMTSKTGNRADSSELLQAIEYQHGYSSRPTLSEVRPAKSWAEK
jgi:hypothetical protein